MSWTDRRRTGARLCAVLEIVFTSLLVITGLAIGLFALLTVYKLFKGQA